VEEIHRSLVIMESPRKLQRTLRKLEAGGEEPVLIFPAMLERYTTERMLAMARIGMADDKKISSWLVATRRNVLFIRTGLAWDNVQTVPLEKIDDVEYVNEFHTNTLKLKVGGTAENIIFYDDMDGIKFYQYIKNGQWKES
jgi:hypothetical protein